MYWFKGEPGSAFTLQLKSSETISALPSAETGRSSKHSALKGSAGKQEGDTRLTAFFLFFSPHNPFPLPLCSHIHSTVNATDHSVWRHPLHCSEVKLWWICIVRNEIWVCQQARTMHADICIDVCQNSCISGWRVQGAAVSHFWNQSSQDLLPIWNDF